MKCFFIEPTAETRVLKFRGPVAVPITEVKYICKQTGQYRWEQEHIPGYSFGPGAMFFTPIWGEQHLMLMFEQGHYINIDGHVANCRHLTISKHKCRTRVGEPPMITVTHNCKSTSMIWTLKDGEFEAQKWKSELSRPDIQ